MTVSMIRQLDILHLAFHQILQRIGLGTWRSAPLAYVVHVAQVAAAAAERAASVAIGVCVLVGQPGVLWADAFPRFDSFGRRAPFLRQLEPGILSGRLPTPAPEVVQVSFQILKP